MTARLDKVLSDIDKLLNNLSREDLKIVQDHVSEKLSIEDVPSDSSFVKNDKPEPHLRIGRPLSPKVIESILAAFLTPEELAEVGENNATSEFPTLPKTITEYIDEDREDRV